MLLLSIQLYGSVVVAFQASSSRHTVSSRKAANFDHGLTIWRVVPTTVETPTIDNGGGERCNNGSSSHSSSSVSSRRSFFTTTAATAVGIGCTVMTTGVESAFAGIDVSGLRVEGGGTVNPTIASQLRAYDGSGSARVKEIQSTLSTAPTTPTTTTTTSRIPSSSSIVNDVSSNPSSSSGVATWAYRSNPGMGPTISRVGTFGTLSRYNDNVVAPKSSNQRRSFIGLQFEFPSDWLQLDRQSGGIQYVDQRNGDKLYLFRATLPQQEDATTTTSLETIPKAWIGDAIFNPDGSFTKSGQTVQDYSVSRAQTLSDCPPGMCAAHRRFRLKFSTVTANGLVVERRGLVDAYQVDQDVYMLMTSSNAVKFEQKDSRERETVENIVSSFQIEV